MLFKELCTGPAHRAQLRRVLEHIAPRHVIYRHHHVDQHLKVAGLGDFGMKTLSPSWMKQRDNDSFGGVRGCCFDLMRMTVKKVQDLDYNPLKNVP